MIKALLLSFIMSVLTGCLAEYKNISDNEKYAGLIGIKYQTLNRLKIHGVTLDKNYKQVIDRYVITEIPGFSGREVVTKKVLQTGSIIQIKKVMKCTNCLPTNISFIIEIVSDQSDQTIPIWLDDLSVIDDKGRVLMNPKLFSKQ